MRKLLVAAASAMFVASAAHAADANNGKTVFARCAICHNVEKDGGNGVGPNLFGIVGRKSGIAEGFNYSAAMKNAHITWTEDNLAKYIAGPAKMVPGNKMAFGGIAQKSQIADVVEYLETLK